MIALIGVCVAAQPGRDSLVVSGWEMKGSLPINNVKAAVQTRDGYLWLATLDGLRRFDGANFKQFDKASAPNFPSGLIACLFEDRAGTLWIGCENGEVVAMTRERFERVAMPADWPTVPVDRILEDVHGLVWILNHRGGVVALRDRKAGQLRAIVSSGDGAAAAKVNLVRDARGSVWLARGKVLLEMSETGAGGRRIEMQAESANPVMFAAREGGFWVADGGVLRRWVDGGWAEDRGRHNWGEAIAPLALEAMTGDVVIPTMRSCVFIINRQGLERQPPNQPGLANDYPRCLCEDNEGVLWVGTGSGGLDILRPRAVTMVEPPDHWLGQPVVTVAPKKQGGLFIGTQGATVYHYDRGLFTGLSRVRDQGNPVIRSLWEDSKNSLWVGTAGAGLWQESQGTYERTELTNNFPKQVSAIFETHAGDLWFGTDEGPVSLHAGKPRSLARDFSIPHADARCFAEGADGTLWVGMQGGGLGRLAAGQWKQFSQADGLAGDYVWSLLAEPDGTLWIGTYGNGLSRYKAGKFSTISVKNGLPSDVICSITDDQDGHLWMSSYAGVFRVSKAALAQCADGASKAMDCQVFGFAEGLVTLEFSGGCQPSACRTSDGRLWFPCSKGLAMIDPVAVRNNAAPPPAVLQQLVIDGEPVDLENLNRTGSSTNLDYEIGPGRRHVEVRYAGLSLSAPDRVRFRYRMQGLENEWVEAGSRRSAYYSYLPPGQYVFEVLACNNGGVWSESGATIRLVVRRFFWQTWWFLWGTALAGMAGAALVATAVARGRERRKREEMERQRASEMERTRIARDIHDQLGIGLTRISMLSQTATAPETNSPAAKQNFEEIRRTTADLTRSMDEIVWAVNPRHDTLDSLLMYLGEFARTFLETAEVRCRLDLPIEVPSVPLSAELRHHVFLAFQEGLNNVVKHAGASEVRIAAELRNDELVLSVDDNGKGFDRMEKADAENSGNGLKNMAARLHDLGGKFECESKIGAGTKIRLIIPIRR